MVVVIIWFIAGGIFIIKKGNDYYDIDLFENDAMMDLSIYATVFSMFILFLATVFRNSMERIDPGRLMHDDQERFVRDYSSG